MRKSLAAVGLTVLILNPSLGQRQKSAYKTFAEKQSVTDSRTVRAKAKSVVGIYFEVIKPDCTGNIRVGGSLFLQQGLLVRHDGRQTTAMALPYVETITDLVFTGPLTGWMIADHNYLFHSSDGGVTWQKSLKAQTNLTSICFSDAMHGWVAGWHGTILNTTDGGASWREQNSGTEYDLKKIQFVNALRGWAVGGKWKPYPWDKWMTVFITTDDGGRTWKSISHPLLPSAFTFVDEQKGWGLDENNILHTIDGGETWTIQRRGNEARLASLFFLNESEGWAAGEEVLHTNDGGRTWSWINEEFELPGKLDYLLFTSSAQGWGIEQYGSNHSPQMLRTTDGGRTWEVIPDTWKHEIVEKLYRAKTRRKASAP